MAANWKRCCWSAASSPSDARCSIVNSNVSRYIRIYFFPTEAFPRLTVTRAEPVTDNDEREMMNDEENEAPESLSFIAHPSSLPLENPPRAGEIPGLYLGPFTTPRAAYWTLEAVRNTFPLRSCTGEITPDINGNSCFYHGIGRCSAPCVGAVSQAGYSQICEDLLQLFKTGKATKRRSARTHGKTR